MIQTLLAIVGGAVLGTMLAGLVVVLIETRHTKEAS